MIPVSLPKGKPSTSVFKTIVAKQHKYRSFLQYAELSLSQNLSDFGCWGLRPGEIIAPKNMFSNNICISCFSSTWHSLNESDLKDIKLIDNKLLRYICSAQAKTALEFLFLETGSLSLSHIISSRRMNYLYEIITRAENELIKRVYMAQKESPSKGTL